MYNKYTLMFIVSLVGILFMISCSEDGKISGLDNDSFNGFDQVTVTQKTSKSKVGMVQCSTGCSEVNPCDEGYKCVTYGGLEPFCIQLCPDDSGCPVGAQCELPAEECWPAISEAFCSDNDLYQRDGCGFELLVSQCDDATEVCNAAGWNCDPIGDGDEAQQCYHELIECGNTVHGNTANGYFVYDEYTCDSQTLSGYMGYEYIYMFFNYNVSVDVTLTDMTSDLDLFVHVIQDDECEERICSYSSVTPGTATETVEDVTVDVIGTQMLIIVDSTSDIPSEYNLNITCNEIVVDGDDELEPDIDTYENDSTLGHCDGGCGVDTPCMTGFYCYSHDGQTNFCVSSCSEGGATCPTGSTCTMTDGAFKCIPDIDHFYCMDNSLIAYDTCGYNYTYQNCIVSNETCNSSIGECELIGGGEFECYNSVDDDEDGLTDCSDLDCAYEPACGYNAGTYCDLCNDGNPCSFAEGFVCTYWEGYDICLKGDCGNDDDCPVHSHCDSETMICMPEVTYSCNGEGDLVGTNYCGNSAVVDHCGELEVCSVANQECELDSQWVCDQGLVDDEYCDCGCGMADPACFNEGCIVGGCYDAACDRCFTANGTQTACVQTDGDLDDDVVTDSDLIDVSDVDPEVEEEAEENYACQSCEWTGVDTHTCPAGYICVKHNDDMDENYFCARDCTVDSYCDSNFGCESTGIGKSACYPYEADRYCLNNYVYTTDNCNITYQKDDCNQNGFYCDPEDTICVGDSTQCSGCTISGDSSTCGEGYQCMFYENDPDEFTFCVKGCGEGQICPVGSTCTVTNDYGNVCLPNITSYLCDDSILWASETCSRDYVYQLCGVNETCDAEQGTCEVNVDGDTDDDTIIDGDDDAVDGDVDNDTSIDGDDDIVDGDTDDDTFIEYQCNECDGGFCPNGYQCLSYEEDPYSREFCLKECVDQQDCPAGSYCEDEICTPVLLEQTCINNEIFVVDSCEINFVWLSCGENESCNAETLSCDAIVDGDAEIDVDPDEEIADTDEEVVSSQCDPCEFITETTHTCSENYHCVGFGIDSSEVKFCAMDCTNGEVCPAGSGCVPDGEGNSICYPEVTEYVCVGNDVWSVNSCSMAALHLNCNESETCNEQTGECVIVDGDDDTVDVDLVDADEDIVDVDEDVVDGDEDVVDVDLVDADDDTVDVDLVDADDDTVDVDLVDGDEDVVDVDLVDADDDTVDVDLVDGDEDVVDVDLVDADDDTVDVDVVDADDEVVDVDLVDGDEDVVDVDLVDGDEDVVDVDLVDADEDVVDVDLVDADDDTVDVDVVDADDDTVDVDLVDGDDDIVDVDVVDADDDTVDVDLVDGDEDVVDVDLVDGDDDIVDGDVVDGDDDTVDVDLVDGDDDIVDGDVVDADEDTVDVDLVDADDDTVDGDVVDADEDTADVDVVDGDEDVVDGDDENCVPDCADRECGSDGCGGNCGSCDDNNVCTEEVCDLTGKCIYSYSGQEGNVCNDGNPCTISDRCTLGLCHGFEKDCSDDIECTVDTCNSDNGSCQNTAQNNLCDDENTCTTDTCSTVDGCTYQNADDWSVCSPYVNNEGLLYLCFENSCETIQENDRCQTAVIMQTEVELEGNLNNAHKYLDLTTDCYDNIFSGKDLFYTFTFDSQKNYEITVTPATGLDVILALHNECSVVSQCLAASDNGGAGQQETLILSGQSGSKIIQVVAANNKVRSGEQSFTISIQETQIDGDLDFEAESELMEDETDESDLDVENELPEQEMEEADNTETGEISDAESIEHEADASEMDSNESTESDIELEEQTEDGETTEGDKDNNIDDDILGPSSNCQTGNNAEGMLFIMAVLLLVALKRKSMKLQD